MTRFCPLVRGLLRDHRLFLDRPLSEVSHPTCWRSKNRIIVAEQCLSPACYCSVTMLQDCNVYVFQYIYFFPKPPFLFPIIVNINIFVLPNTPYRQFNLGFVLESPRFIFCNIKFLLHMQMQLTRVGRRVWYFNALFAIAATTSKPPT